MSTKVMISTKAKFAAMKILQSGMKNLKALHTNYSPHQKHFHCNTNTRQNKTISIHSIICVNIQVVYEDSCYTSTSPRIT